MNRQQFDQISDDLLSLKDTGKLIRFLTNRGWQMSLLELDQERRVRGLSRKHS